MKLVFFGSGEFGRAMLDALVAAGFPPRLVVTQPPRRRRRGGREEPTPVHAAAEAAGIAPLFAAKINAPDSLDALRAAGADLFAVAEYGQLLSQELLDIPPLGAINVHTSLLPRHRGATPVAAAILAGDEETGVTIQRVVRALDAGPVFAERRVAILPDDTTGTLTERLAPLGAAALLETVRAFATGTPPPARPQDESRVTVCRRLRTEDARLDWRRGAAELERAVRAYQPRPGARATLDREEAIDLVVRSAAVVEGAGEPGVVARVEAAGIDVACGDGCLRLLEVVPAARRPMEARAFANGYRLSAGERFR